MALGGYTRSTEDGRRDGVNGGIGEHFELLAVDTLARCAPRITRNELRRGRDLAPRAVHGLADVEERDDVRDSEPNARGRKCLAWTDSAQGQ